MIRTAWLLLSLLIVISGCGDDDTIDQPLELQRAFAGSLELTLDLTTEDVPVDRTISLTFSSPVDPATLEDGIILQVNGQEIPASLGISSNSNTVNLNSNGPLQHNSEYTISITENLRSTGGGSAIPSSFSFRTTAGALQLLEVQVNGEAPANNGRIRNVPVNLAVRLEFNGSVNMTSFDQAFTLSGASTQITGSDNNTVVEITSTSPLDYLREYTLRISDDLQSSEGGSFNGYTLNLFTQIDSTYKFPEISREELLTKVQEQTFRYFWDFAHPVSGLARERNTSGNTVTIGGSGFGVMTIIAGIERNFISREEGVDRLETIVTFLENADRFHGVWPHWMNGNTGATIPFSANDDGADLVETAFMIQGLLTVSEYLSPSDPQELAIINKITQLWEAVEWDWFTQGGQDVLYWHWSPNFGWEKNLAIRGWNESLIVYVLAASSPTHPIEPSVYHEGWARSGGMVNGQEFYGYELPLGPNRGGPLFFSHYSFLGLDPRNLSDQYANYWEQNTAHSLINQAYCIQNPLDYVGYSDACWGLTASDNHIGYSAHSPANDLGVITPTAALSSMPYTPEQSIKAMEFFYYVLGDRIWGEYGFNDAFNMTENWYADSYLAIDQGPIVIMIENHRSALLWNLFMQNQQIQAGLDKLGFTY